MELSENEARDPHLPIDDAERAQGAQTAVDDGARVEQFGASTLRGRHDVRAEERHDLPEVTALQKCNTYAEESQHREERHQGHDREPGRFDEAQRPPHQPGEDESDHESGGAYDQIARRGVVETFLCMFEGDSELAPEDAAEQVSHRDPKHQEDEHREVLRVSDLLTPVDETRCQESAEGAEGHEHETCDVDDHGLAYPRT